MTADIKAEIFSDQFVDISQSDAAPGIINQSLASSFIRTLIYFDIFSYPLTSREIFEFSRENTIDRREGHVTIEKLLEQGLISSHSGYYFIGKDDQKVNQRISGNKLAAKRMKQARFFSGIIASFPFTRGVYISGSLSKDYMDEASDIDYFIITSPNRLWISRTLLILFKKLFLLNSRKNFCINYLVDTDSMEIKEKNIYSATEIVTLLPMHNGELFEKFLEANHWVKEYYPNFRQKTEDHVKGFPLFKTILEKLLDNRMGNALDNFFYKTTAKYWESKHNGINIMNPESELYWDKHISQYNPKHFRQNVLNRFHQKILEFETKTGFPVGE
jgi:hypothetical protein